MKSLQHKCCDERRHIILKCGGITDQEPFEGNIGKKNHDDRFFDKMAFTTIRSLL